MHWRRRYSKEKFLLYEQLKHKSIRSLEGDICASNRSHNETIVNPSSINFVDLYIFSRYHADSKHEKTTKQSMEVQKTLNIEFIHAAPKFIHLASLLAAQVSNWYFVLRSCSITSTPSVLRKIEYIILEKTSSTFMHWNILNSSKHSFLDFH